MIPSFDGGRPMKRRIVLVGLLMAGALSIAVAAQQQAPAKPSASAIKVEKLSDNLYVLNALAAGSGGNTSIFHHRNRRRRRGHEESRLGPAAARQDQDHHRTSR
jgi:uncharacterized low-complexity protein